MTDLIKKAREKLAFDERDAHQKAILHGYDSNNFAQHKAYERGRQEEHARTQPIIEALLKVADLVQDAQCDCSVAERDSGHLVGCWKPEFDDALEKLSQAVEE